MTALLEQKVFNLADILGVYTGSNAETTRDLYALLEGHGPLGAILLNLFRAEKASERAKGYSRHKGDAYQKKNWSMSNLCAALVTHGDALGIVWGWAEDPAQSFHRWVLYVDAPAGQVSFHAETRGQGPLYTKAWDRIKGQGPTRIARWIVLLLNRSADPRACQTQEEFSNVVTAHFESATERERLRFEAWASSDLRGPCEASALFTRSIGGDYVNRVASGAWAAWQARGLADGET